MTAAAINPVLANARSEAAIVSGLGYRGPRDLDP
jgi:hypothetical protein